MDNEASTLSNDASPADLERGDFGTFTSNRGFDFGTSYDFAEQVPGKGAAGGGVQCSLGTTLSQALPVRDVKRGGRSFFSRRPKENAANVRSAAPGPAKSADLV